MYGGTSDEKEAERKIFLARQRGSVSSYASYFLGLTAPLAWDDNALVVAFYRGLDEKIRKTYINRDKPSGLHPLIKDAIAIDEKMQEF